MAEKRKTRSEQIEDVRMTLEEARALRLKKHEESLKKSKDSGIMSDTQKRQAFQEYWTAARRHFGSPPRDVEDTIWAHLRSIKCDDPSSFEKGVIHFGLKRI